MDQILKARNMSSASARRRRIEEMEEEKEQARQRRQQYKEQVLLRSEVVEATADDENDFEYASGFEDEEGYQLGLHRHEREDSVETPSEFSVATPANTPPAPAGFGKESIDISMTRSILSLDEESTSSDDDRRLTLLPPPSPKPLLQASLTTQLDFNYDRYSLIMGLPQDAILTPELENNEGESPIETATPISYTQVRPSMISINKTCRGNKRKTASIQSPLSQEAPPLPLRSHKRISQIGTNSGFLASEATLFEVPDLPANAFNLIANASRDSLLLDEATGKASSRRPSVPLLTTALKSSHSRMSSGFRSLVKSPTEKSNHSHSSSRADSHHQRPSTGTVNSFQGVPPLQTSLNSPARPESITRPQTARNYSTGALSQHSMTALPAVPTHAADEADHDTMTQTRTQLSRKKSFSALRKRSESIGQAIKLKTKNKQSSKSDTTAPPTPVLSTPNNIQYMDLNSFPTPPLPSPRIRKSIASFSPFTPNRSSTAPIGLGLRSVDGLNFR